jgi:Putative MetA-pathway of phenol degradation
MLLSCLGFVSFPLLAQDLDPRAYVRVPIKTTTLITGFGYSYGEVVSDPSLAIKDIKADIQAATVGVAHSFNFFGLSSTALVVLPYSWAEVSGKVQEQQQRVTRSGLADMRLRYSVLLLGGKAATLPEMMKDRTRRTILGASLNVSAPSGEFIKGKLINLGTNRWGFRPELALSQPLGKRWTADVYAGLWLFTNNAIFYPGDVLRRQDPMGAFQAHISYNIKPTFWIALDGTFYRGGASSLNGVYNDDRQSNTRIGMTAVIPTGKFSSLKFSASTGAVVRIGQDFTSYSLGWQYSWIKGLNKK